jgi:hypothetical protein
MDAQKRKEKIDDWENVQKGRGRSRHLVKPDYNPLSGTSSGSSYRPSSQGNTGMELCPSQISILSYCSFGFGYAIRSLKRTMIKLRTCCIKSENTWPDHLRKHYSNTLISWNSNSSGRHLTTLVPTVWLSGLTRIFCASSCLLYRVHQACLSCWETRFNPWSDLYQGQIEEKVLPLHWHQ